MQIEAEAVLYRSVDLHQILAGRALTEALKYSPRRIPTVRKCSITLGRNEWPYDPYYDYPDITKECAKHLNTLLKMLTRLQSLKIERGHRGYSPGPAYETLGGCTFKLLSFINPRMASSISSTSSHLLKSSTCRQSSCPIRYTFSKTLCRNSRRSAHVRRSYAVLKALTLSDDAMDASGLTGICAQIASSLACDPEHL